jgi:lipopolysaccharide/colanic/teichoic acid biosynthesis glycosyltransferase
VAENKRTIASVNAAPAWRKIQWVYPASLLLGFVLAALIWQLMVYSTRPADIPTSLVALGLVLLSSLLAVVADWGISPTSFTRGWQHRTALGISLAISFLFWLIVLVGARRPATFGMLLAVSLGALIGSLATTWIREGFYENNQPPSHQIRQEVITRHRELIGNPPRGNIPKRIFDIFLAGFGLLISAPVWILITIMIWIEDPGPVVFIKNSVGKGGPNFHQFKFRTMVSGAEVDTGPIPARESDSRVLRSGKFLRKTALDELPQLFNIFKGEMSFVGPRPQRTVLVYLYLRDLPGFAERHAVLPGLAGLAQVAGNYFATPLQKLRYDRIYARHASLGFDLKLLAIAFALVFWLRWRKDWDGKIPRSWLHN